MEEKKNMLGLLAINVCYFGAVINVRIYAWW